MNGLEKKLGLCLLIISICSTITLSQSKNDKTVVGTVGKEKITYGELKANVSTLPDSSPSLQELEEFLPIYLEYKAKIQFAEKEGVLNDKVLLNELDQYSKQASYSYWLENRIKETEFERYYDRASTELKSEHILIAVGNDASPSDTLAAYQQLIEARNKFLNGTSFSELDREYSSKQAGRSMGGDLPWFSIGTTVKEFEDIIFSLDVGEVSMPFRTQFGYHIVHLQDKRSRTLSREVSHIFTRAGVQTSKEKIDNAYSKLEEGYSWNEVVVEFSDDNLSAANGGRIGWINYGRYRTGFVDSVMSLSPETDYSTPIQTSYGYHIFRIDSVQTFESEEEKKNSYMKEFLDSPNYRKSNSFVINWLKNNFNNSVNQQILEDFKSKIDQSDTLKIKNIQLSEDDTPIFSFENYTFTDTDYHRYLDQTHPDASARSYSDKWFDDFKTYAIDSIVVKLTISEFPEFQSTLDNYKKGLAVYQVNDTYLWSAATVDTSKLVDLYEKNSSVYSYPQRHYYHLISALTDTTLDRGIEFVDSGNHPDSIRSYNPKIAVIKDSTGVFTDEPYDKLKSMKPGTFSERFEYKRRSAVFYLNEILPARKMTFDEAFNRLLADYQPKREEKWLNQLKKEYRIKMNLKKLRSAFNKDESL
ncbi:MAG: peptidylprolyl isomerase [Balneola sp.]|nr:peptidylprolyl isomerase [Balneola sp.]MBO6650718.1 peptidylprolyl isomerase [Balneola sp.]MBO6710630.1 peptidylprolyl isomerase [Balneola sp.]MBO6799316.1 peptidylprolyl isomerase [Balneola sp.]MBO6869555.1 peptidylprolyl isomerase [Balneola sp.]